MHTVKFGNLEVVIDNNGKVILDEAALEISDFCEEFMKIEYDVKTQEYIEATTYEVKELSEELEEKLEDRDLPIGLWNKIALWISENVTTTVKCAMA